MKKIEFLEYAIGLCEKKIEEDIESCNIDGHFEKIIELRRGLKIAITIAEEDWPEEIMAKYIREMIEHI